MQYKAISERFRPYLHHSSYFYIQTGFSQTSIQCITSLVKPSFKFYKHRVSKLFPGNASLLSGPAFTLALQRRQQLLCHTTQDAVVRQRTENNAAALAHLRAFGSPF